MQQTENTKIESNPRDPCKEVQEHEEVCCSARNYVTNRLLVPWCACAPQDERSNVPQCLETFQQHLKQPSTSVSG